MSDTFEVERDVGYGLGLSFPGAPSGGVTADERFSLSEAKDRSVARLLGVGARNSLRASILLYPQGASEEAIEVR